MHIPYHTRRRLERLGAAFLLILTLAILIWLCWVVWLERYVVYTRDGAQINLELDPQLPVGQVALPPDEAGFIDIFYNEGLNAVENVSRQANNTAGCENLNEGIVPSGREKRNEFCGCRPGEQGEIHRIEGAAENRKVHELLPTGNVALETHTRIPAMA